MTLADDLSRLDPTLLQELYTRGFSEGQLAQWAATMGGDRDARNRLRGRVEAPLESDLDDAPEPADPAYAGFDAAGRAAIAAGQLAVCVLAGGMATRMGGVVKALVDALPGHTFLDLRLAEQAAATARFGGAFPLWLMTSRATSAPIRAALGDRLDGDRLAEFQQCCSLRLTPEGRLFVGDDGAPSVYATGHGDLPDALRSSGLLARFVAGGGKYLWIENLDNLGATVDPAILGWHIAHGDPLSVELVDKEPGDRGGGPVRHEGRRIVTELFRMPASLDPDSIPVFNTNTFLVDAAALLACDFEFTYVEVEKKVDGRAAVQFERLLGEITSALDTRYLRVPRRGSRSRFLPVKDPDELAKRRAEIELIARERRMLQP